MDRRQSRYPPAEERFRNAMALYEELKDTAGIAATLNLFGSIDLIQGRFVPALARFEESLALYEGIGDQSGMSVVLTYIGHLHNIQGRYEQALATYRRTLELNEGLGSKYNLVGSLLSIGNILYQQSRNEQALKVFQRSLTLSEELGAKGLLASAHLHIGRIHMLQGRNDAALDHYRKGTALFEELEDEGATAIGLSHIADVYVRMGRDREALAYYERGLRAFEAGGEKQHIALTLHRIGKIHAAAGKHAEAIATLHRSLALREELNERAAVAEVLTELGALEVQLGKFDSAIVLGTRAYAMAREIGATVQMKDASKTLSEAYAATHDFARAFEFHRAYTAHKDSVLNIENVKSINEMTAKYETERNEQKIALLEKDRSLQELELQRRQEKILRQQLESRQKQQMLELLGKEKEIHELSLTNTNAELDRERMENRQKNNEVALLMKDRQLQSSLLAREELMRNVSIAGFVVLLMVSGLLFHRYRYRRRTSEQLASTLEQLRATQAQLIHSEKMVTLGEMTAGLAHEIKNPLNFVTNFSAVAHDMLTDLEQAPDAEERAAILADLRSNLGRIQEHGRRADSIIQGMMQHARGGSGDWEQVDINALVEDAAHLAYNGARATHLAFDVRLIRDYHPLPLELKVVPQEISRVVLNILSNAMYALRNTARDSYEPVAEGPEADGDSMTPTHPAAPTIWLRTARVPRGIEIRIRDNGPGVPDVIRQKIFQPFFTTKPTGEGTGLGLSMSYDIIVNGHGGELICNSSENGAEFVIVLPARKD